VPQGFAITGTDTGIGKTIVAAGLAGALGATYWKPVQAGLDEATDSQIVARLAGARLKSIIPEAYRLKTACSPHEAARIDGVSIELSNLGLPDCDGPLIVEGAGGLKVPISEEALVIDMFAAWPLKAVLVARTSLGTINHSLLSLMALRNAWIDIAGVLFVGDENPSSEAAIVHFGNVAHLGRLPWLDPLDAASLAGAVEANIRLDLLS
jgi:dethiobiotin synthetase